MEEGNGYKDRLNIEKRLTCLETKMDEVMTNHLPHLSAKMDRIQWLLIVTLVGIVANLLNSVI